MKEHLKEKAEKAQEDLLKVVLEVFKYKNNWVEKAPSYITDTLGLFKKLKKEGKHELTKGQTHRFAQGLINELLNRGQLEHKKEKGYKYIGNKG